MSREIKFRGWHTELKRMFSCEKMVIDQLTLLPDGRFINVHGGNTKLSRIFPRDEFIPLQYAGCKDIKRTKEYPEGQEIYEDDICLDSITHKIYKVKWVDGGFNILSGEHLKVIGNAHQHPKLLE